MAVTTQAMLQPPPCEPPVRLRTVLGAWAVFALLAAVHVHLAVRRPGGPDGMSDLHVYVGAVRHLLEHGDLYGFVSSNGDRFTYPPAAGLLMVPLLALSEPALRVVWTLAQLAEVVVLAALVLARSSHPLLTRTPRPVALPLLSCLLALSYPVFTGLFLGQVSLLVTLLVLLDALDVVPPRWRGVLTGVAAALKLTPLAFVPYLWLTGRRRAAGVALGTAVGCTLLAWLVLPAGSLAYWSTRADAPGLFHLAQTDNQSVQGLLARTSPAEPVGTAVLVAVTVLLPLAAYARSTRLHRAGLALPGAVVVGAMAVVVSPVSWSHHQVPLVLAAACALAASARWVSVAWSLGVTVVTALPLPFLVAHLQGPVRLLAENAGLLLALLLCCAVPFAAAQPGRAGPASPGPRAWWWPRGAVEPDGPGR